MVKSNLQGDDLKQNLAERIRFEHLISNLSARFITIRPEQVDQAIEAALLEILEFFQVDRIGLVRHDINSDYYQHILAAYSRHISPVPVAVDLPTSLFPYTYKKVIREGAVASFSTLEALPDEAAVDKQNYENWGVKSFLIVPVSVGKPIEYLIVINSVLRECEWPKAYIPRLQLLGEIFVNVLELKRTRLQLEDRLKFEALLSVISAKFVNLSARQVDVQIENALHQIVQLLDFDRIVITQFSHETSRTIATHSITAPGVWMEWKELDNDLFPWAVGNLMRGKTVELSCLEDLPVEAVSDRELFVRIGIKSCVMLPLTVSGNVLGFMGCSVLRTERIWEKEVIQGLQLIADVFANAISRKNKDAQLQERFDEIETLKRQFEKENITLRREIKLRHVHEEIVGRSEAMKRILSQAEQVAMTDATVLVLGETGTGKELLAKAIHHLSRRKDRPLMTVSCASLSPSLMESEIFGREKGAYTGALTRMAGRFEVADGSTIFLDEIGELPLDTQSKLLRVLEEGCFERLGSTKTLKVDVRIIAATNRDLDLEVKEGRFRKDLYYRLQVFPISIPPLRERSEDIPLLVWALVGQLEKKIGKRIDSVSRKSMDVLKRYSWPGNVRELRNVIEHAMIVSRGGKLVVNLTDRRVAASVKPDDSGLQDMERRHILNVLEKTGWRISGSAGAAELLGLKRTTLQSRIKKLGIRRSAP